MRRVLVKKLLRDLVSRKGSLVALLAIVAIGVGCYLAMSSLYLDLDQARARYYDAYRVGDLTVDFKRAPGWTLSLAERHPGVRDARLRVSLPVRVTLRGSPDPIPGTAISMPADRRPVLNDVLLRTGTWFTGPDQREVILNQAFAEANDLVPGDRLRVQLLDRAHDLLIVGTGMSPEYVYLMPPGGGLAPDPARTGVMYLPERFLQEAADLQGAYNQLVARAHDTARPALTLLAGQLKDRFDPYGANQGTPWFDQASMRFLADELAGLETSGTALPAIFLGVAALVLNVLIGRLVLQQRTIIGTFKALGLSTGRVALHYLTYGLVIGLAGGLLGLALGWVLQGAMLGLYRQFYAIPDIASQFRYGIAARALGLSVGCAALGTFKGLRIAARLMPAEAMRTPAPRRGRHILPERLPFLWNRLSFRSKLALRTIFRNRFRSAVSVLASGIATALIVATFSTQDSIDFIMEHEFARLSHEDISVSLREATALQAGEELVRQPEVASVEPELTVACDLSNGSLTKRIGVLGLPPGGRLRTPLLGTGERLVVAPGGLVLTRKLAEILEVAAGDTLRVRALVGRRQESVVPVLGIVDTYLGLVAYADIHFLSRLVGEEVAANGYLITTWKQSSDDSLLNELERRPDVLGLSDRRRAFSQLDATWGESMGAIIGVLVLFAGLIAFGSVLNAALVSLSERQREVGTLRVLGYGATQVAGIFSLESFLLNGLGIALGLVGGVGLAHILALAYSTELYRMPAVLSVERSAQAVFAMVVFVVLAQLIILRLIRRFRWLDVLSYKE